MFTYSRGYPRWLPDDLYTTIFQHFKCIFIKICIFWMLKWHIDTHVSEMHFYAHNMSINKTTFWEQVCIIWFFFMLTLYVYLKKKKTTFKCNIGGCHVQTDNHWLLIGCSSAAVSEQVWTLFGLLVRKPRCACRWWGGSLWRTSSSVPFNCLPCLKIVK